GPDASSCAPSVSAPVRTAPPRVHGRMPSSARRTAPGPCARLQAVRERWSSMQPARSARHAGPARRRRSARTVGRLVLLAIALLALALVLSPPGLGLASAHGGDPGDESGQGVPNNPRRQCINREPRWDVERGMWVYVCLDPRPDPGGQEDSGVSEPSDGPPGPSSDVGTGGYDI